MYKYKRINWNAMHARNYDGSCCYCGSYCTDEKSREQWQNVQSNIDIANQQEDFKAVKYYAKRIDDKLSYRFN